MKNVVVFKTTAQSLTTNRGIMPPHRKLNDGSKMWSQQRSVAGVDQPDTRKQTRNHSARLDNVAWGYVHKSAKFTGIKKSQHFTRLLSKLATRQLNASYSHFLAFLLQLEPVSQPPAMPDAPTHCSTRMTLNMTLSLVLWFVGLDSKIDVNIWEVSVSMCERAAAGTRVTGSQVNSETKAKQTSTKKHGCIWQT